MHTATVRAKRGWHSNACAQWTRSIALTGLGLLLLLIPLPGDQQRHRWQVAIPNGVHIQQNLAHKQRRRRKREEHGQEDRTWCGVEATGDARKPCRALTSYRSAFAPICENQLMAWSRANRSRCVCLCAMRRLCVLLCMEQWLGVAAQGKSTTAAAAGCTKSAEWPSLRSSKLGYTRRQFDKRVYVKTSKTCSSIIHGVLVDDMFSACYSTRDRLRTDLVEMEADRSALGCKYSVKDLGDANMVLGMRVTRGCSRRLLWMGQEQYIGAMLTAAFCPRRSSPSSPLAADDPMDLHGSTSSAIAPSRSPRRCCRCQRRCSKGVRQPA